jgi:hypothetical protein
MQLQEIVLLNPTHDHLERSSVWWCPAEFQQVYSANAYQFSQAKVLLSKETMFDPIFAI